MKKLLLKTMLLLCALVAGSASVWGADDLTDELTASLFAATTTTYTDFSGVSVEGGSAAVYAGNNCKSSNGAIQLRSKNSNSGIVSTTSGGKRVKSVSIDVESGTNTLDIYGSNTAYQSASDLYNTSKQGTKLGSLSNDGTFTITGDYKYIGLRSNNGALYLTSVTIVWEPESASTAATTTTIDASGITNTDVYVGTAAGSLTATVKDESSNTVAGAAVTWSGDNDEVATIDPSTGAVTLVAAGVVNFTAAYAGVTDTYAASSDTYKMTVTSSEPYVQPTEIEITPNYTFWGKNAQFSGNANDNLSGSQDNVSLAWTRGSGSTYANQNAMRFYKDNTLTFTAPTGYEIKSIKIVVSDTYNDLTFSPTGFDSETTTWSGAATTVTMSRPSNGSSYATISKFTITIGTPSSIANPTFSPDGGTYDEAQNVTITCETADAAIYYTLDGTTPTSSSTLYTGPVTISETKTLKAIAIKDAESSSVASATYTIELPLTTIADVKAQANNSTVRVKLTDAQVVYVHGNDIYVRDATGAMDFYQSGISELETGDIFDATIEATYTLYKGMPELMTFTSKSITKKGNSTVIAKVITTAEQAAANVCDLVKFEGVQLTQESTKYYIGTTGVQLYDKFKVSYATEISKDVDVSGIIVPYGNTEPYTYEICPRFDTDVVYLDNSEEVAISAAGVATFCSAKALDFTAVDAIKVYIAKADADKVTLTEIKKVPANTGVILMNALGMNEGAVAAVNVPYLDGDAEDVSDNELVGITTATVVNATVDGKYNYILSNETAGVGFYRAVNGVQLAANKAYLSTTVNAAVRDFLGFTEDDSDAIIEIAKNEKMSAIYDLSGRRVVKPTKGLYIVNGKKVVK